MNKSMVFLILFILYLPMQALAENPEKCSCLKVAFNDSYSYYERAKSIECIIDDLGSESLPYLRVLLKDNDSSIRILVIRHLTKIKANSVADVLLDHYSKLEKMAIKDNLIRQELVMVTAALYKVNKDSLVNYVFKALNDQDLAVQHSAIRALSMVDNEKSKNILWSIINNSSDSIKLCFAATSLVELKDDNIKNILAEFISKDKHIHAHECFEDLINN